MCEEIRLGKIRLGVCERIKGGCSFWLHSRGRMGASGMGEGWGPLAR